MLSAKKDNFSKVSSIGFIQFLYLIFQEAVSKDSRLTCQGKKVSSLSILRKTFIFQTYLKKKKRSLNVSFKTINEWQYSNSTLLRILFYSYFYHCNCYNRPASIQTTVSGGHEFQTDHQMRIIRLASMQQTTSNVSHRRHP